MKREILSVIIDSNEYSRGKAWYFPHLVCHVKPLIKYGCDYSVRGQIGLIGVERKSWADYVCCVGKQWPRFQRQLAKLKKNKYRCVIVEGDIGTPIPKYSTLTQMAIIGQTTRIAAMGIPIIFASTRPRAAIMCRLFLQNALRRIRISDDL